MHECFHCWQLFSSRWLLRLVEEEWLRALALGPDQIPLPAGPLRRSFGRVAPGEPFSVRDLVECMARFWDIHTRGPTRLLLEEHDDLGGRLSEIEAFRNAKLQGGYLWEEFDALMTEGREHAEYSAPYRWLLEQASASPVVQAFRNPIRQSTSWVANIVLPMATFVALNSDQPTATWTAAVELLLEPDAIGFAATQRDPTNQSINMDWLICWPLLMPPLIGSLRHLGHNVMCDASMLQNPSLGNHPVWCWLPDRLNVLSFLVSSVANSQLVYRDLDVPLAVEQVRTVGRTVYYTDLWAVPGLAGQPSCRTMLGMSFAPPVLRFLDGTTIIVTDFGDAGGFLPPFLVERTKVEEAVAEVEAQFTALRQADFASRYGLSPRSFRGPLEVS